MNDFPLLGCLHDCKVLSASTSELVLDGPIYTAGKINKNGWGIPEDEAKLLQDVLTGSPIRYCPQGKPLPGLAAEHYCDAQGTDRDIVGEIIKVYPAGVDDKGRTVYHQQARITNPNTAKGIISGSIPRSWSVFFYARDLKDKMVHGIRKTGAAASIVTLPAYTEASFEWQKMAAGFFTLNKPGSQKPGSNTGDPPMGNEMNTNQAPPAQMPAGGAPQTKDTGLTSTSMVPPVTVNNFYPTAGNVPNTKEAAAKPEAHGETKDVKTYTEEELQAKILESIKAHDEMLKVQGLASDVMKLQVAAGVVEDKKEVLEAREKDLVKLGASVLEGMKTDYTKVAEALKKTTGKGEKPMSAGIVPAPQTPEIALSEQAVGVLEKMRIPTADYEKYARTPSRSLLNIGGNKV